MIQFEIKLVIKIKYCCRSSCSSWQGTLSPTCPLLCRVESPYLGWSMAMVSPRLEEAHLMTWVTTPQYLQGGQVQGGYIPAPQPQAPTHPQSRPTATAAAGKQMKQYNSPQPLYSQVIMQLIWYREDHSSITCHPQDNIEEFLDQQAEVLANGVKG